MSRETVLEVELEADECVKAGIPAEMSVELRVKQWPDFMGKEVSLHSHTRMNHRADLLPH